MGLKSDLLSTNVPYSRMVHLDFQFGIDWAISRGDEHGINRRRGNQGFLKNDRTPGGGQYTRRAVPTIATLAAMSRNFMQFFHGPALNRGMACCPGVLLDS
ncbi:MAG: hypothetical protein MUF86_01215 [Akkermansiaceae bacterium]|jgi:hypothetical protein|nr:hypothetical protein [Akkermansiaceae bacterium]